MTMMIKTLLTASAAIALLAGGAHAGEGAKKAKPADAAATQMQEESGKAMDKAVDQSMGAASPDTSVNPPASDAYSTSTTATTPSSAMDATTAGADTSAVVATRVTAMEPVPDTKANRAKFPPLSATGRATTPRGN
jgi:hypothetical protein